MNAVEREPVETRVLNPTASEASYKPKQRSYRKTNLKKKVLAPNCPVAKMSGAEMSSAETYPTPIWHLDKQQLPLKLKQEPHYHHHRPTGITTNDDNDVETLTLQRCRVSDSKARNVSPYVSDHLLEISPQPKLSITISMQYIVHGPDRL